MSFFKKLFDSLSKSSKDREIKQQAVNLSLDDSFVHNFINKGGKFLYCTSMKEVVANLKSITIENNWQRLVCSDIDLLKLLTTIDVNTQLQFSNTIPFFTSCEHLIANTGDILFSSNQLGSRKLSTFPENFIVYATTSQLVKDMGEGLTGIKAHFSGNIPTNISAVKNYSVKKNTDETFMDYGNTNTKNLYLLLFEDL